MEIGRNDLLIGWFGVHLCLRPGAGKSPVGHLKYRICSYGIFLFADMLSEGRSRSSGKIIQNQAQLG